MYEQYRYGGPPKKILDRVSYRRDALGDARHRRIPRREQRAIARTSTIRRHRPSDTFGIPEVVFD